jgi:spore coat polysaccharide biosynthesis predicted glycosyltransferase SpsG
MKKSVTKIGIFCDLSPFSGLGHIKRMVSLNNSMEKSKNKCFFFFEKKNLKFIKKYTQGLNVVFVEKINSYNFLSKLLSELKISKIILDSYKLDYKLERYFVKKGFFTVAIDDHYKKHAANIVISNRSENPKNTHVKKNQIWLTGPEYALIDINKKKKKITTKKILLHAGGASLYKPIKTFVITLLKFLENKRINLTILCTNNVSKKYIINLCRENRIKLKLKFIDYINKLSSTFSKYEIIFGPAGTTTFEIIGSGSLPFSFPLIDDGRDSGVSWLGLSHLMHLQSKEIKDKKILIDSLNLIFRKKNELLNILNKNSKLIDGKGADRLKKIILQNTKNSNMYKKNSKIRNTKSYSSEICSYLDSRNFMESRNSKISRSTSFNPHHIITWPEHLNWWLDKNILKYKIKKNNITLAYYWVSKKSDNFGTFVQSGWFLERNISIQNDLNSKLKISYATLKFQLDTVKKFYKEMPWIVTMRKKNIFVKFLNKNLGFKNASELSLVRAKNNYSNAEFDKIFEVMEMNL